MKEIYQSNSKDLAKDFTNFKFHGKKVYFCLSLYFYTTAINQLIIRLTKGRLNSQHSVLNPLPAISGHVSFF